METTLEPNDVEAVYDLEYAARCPACREMMQQIHVVRLLRTRVNFTSSLPRRGYAVTCPSCSAVMTASIGGLLPL